MQVWKNLGRIVVRTPHDGTSVEIIFIIYIIFIWIYLKYKTQANLHRRHLDFDVGDYVMIRIRP